MERRDLIRTAALGLAAAALPVAQAGAAPAHPTWSPAETFDHGGMKFRMLGRTGERVSLVGIGGFHLARPGLDGPSADDATRIVRTAIDAGVNFCDNCWDYNKGESEKRLGNALRDGYRARAFLMTKIDGRTAGAATGQIETSLHRLQTDHLDLVQFHEIIRMDDPERVFAQGGALEAVLRAKEAGKIRHIGFTGHKSPAIHKHMFDVAAAHNFHFDTVQMPVNIMDAHFDSFSDTIFPVTARNGTAVLAMKTFGDSFILDSGVAQPEEMLHYSMSQPVAVVVTGCDKLKILEQALAAVRSYTPMPAAQQAALLARSKQAAADGKTERYKVSQHFDGTAKNPHWLTTAQI